jgi:hypothetical protein
LKDDQQIGVELVLNLVIPYLAREGVPASRFATLAPDSPMTTGSRSLEANPDLLKQLFDDPEFHTILETRYGFLEHTIVEYDDLIVATNSIIAKIEASLTDANQ